MCSSFAPLPEARPCFNNRGSYQSSADHQLAAVATGSDKAPVKGGGHTHEVLGTRREEEKRLGTLNIYLVLT